MGKTFTYKEKWLGLVQKSSDRSAKETIEDNKTDLEVYKPNVPDWWRKERTLAADRQKSDVLENTSRLFTIRVNLLLAFLHISIVCIIGYYIRRYGNDTSLWYFLFSIITILINVICFVHRGMVVVSYLFK